MHAYFYKVLLEHYTQVFNSCLWLHIALQYQELSSCNRAFATHKIKNISHLALLEKVCQSPL